MATSVQEDSSITFLSLSCSNMSPLFFPAAGPLSKQTMGAYKLPCKRKMNIRACTVLVIRRKNQQVHCLPHQNQAIRNKKLQSMFCGQGSLIEPTAVKNRRSKFEGHCGTHITPDSRPDKVDGIKVGILLNSRQTDLGRSQRHRPVVELLQCGSLRKPLARHLYTQQRSTNVRGFFLQASDPRVRVTRAHTIGKVQQ